MASTPWVQRFQSHGLHQTLQQFNAAMQQAEGLAKKDKTAVVALERLRQIDQRLRRLLKSVDPGLVPLDTLNNLQANVARQVGELNNYVSNGNTAHLSGANDGADGVLMTVVALPVPKVPADVKELEEASVSLSKSVAEYIESLSQKAEEARTKLDGLDTRTEETSAEITGQKGRLDSAIAQYQQQFSEAESRRREEAEKAEKDREQRFAAGEEKRNVEFSGSATKLGADAKGVVEELQNYKSQAEKLVSVIGNTGMAGGYQRVADKARRASIIWHVVAFLSLAGLISFALFEFLPALKLGFTWELFAARLLVTTAFVLLFGYAAREAERQQREEQRNRRMELELASIDPYLALLPDDKRVEVKRIMAERFFGQNTHTLNGVGSDKESAALPLDILKLVL